MYSWVYIIIKLLCVLCTQKKSKDARVLTVWGPDGQGSAVNIRFGGKHCGWVTNRVTICYKIVFKARPVSEDTWLAQGSVPGRNLFYTATNQSHTINIYIRTCI